MVNDKQLTLKQIKEAFNGDEELMLFFNEWWKAGRNSTKAYSALHQGKYDLEDPDQYAVCATLGSRMFKKVDIFAILTMYGLGPERYFKQMDEGLEATKRDHFSGEISADHKTRRDYHKALGEILGYEKTGNQTNIQVNVTPILGGKTKDE